MMSSLSFDITPKHLYDLQELENKIADIYALLKTLPEDELYAIQKFTRVSIIGSSTRIENALLTDLEVDWIDTVLISSGKTNSFENCKELIENKLSKDRERSIEEVAGCRNMLLLIYQDARSLVPLREIDIRSLHHELLSTYPKAHSYIGKYKEQPNYVVQENRMTGEKHIVFKTADAGPITLAAMHDLIEWYNKTYERDLRSIFIACEFVYRFLAIHPFQDGNGRLGRGLFLLLLLQSRSAPLASIAKYLPIDRSIEKYKEEYYFVLNRCSGGMFKQDAHDYKIHYFVEFMLKVLSNSLDSIEIYREKYKSIQMLSDSALKVINCFKEHPEIRLNTQRIANETGLPLRTVAYALSGLFKNNLIQKSGQGSATKYQITF
jgi:Fic family protein